MTEPPDRARAGAAVGSIPTPWPRWIEALTVATGWAIAFAAFGPALRQTDPRGEAAALLAILAVGLWWVAVMAVVRSDLRDYTIPDGASAAIAALGLGVAVLGPVEAGDGWDQAALAGAAALADGVVAFALFWAVAWAFRRFGRRDALGFGDVKLAGASALWLAPAEAALALEIAALAALAALVVVARRGAWRDTAVPFGAFLAPAAWLVFVLSPLLGGSPAALP